VLAEVGVAGTAGLAPKAWLQALRSTSSASGT
jgi:hypothetical protein